MIVDSSLITNLALGTDRRIPEAGDSQLIVPATLLPVTSFLQPTLINILPTEPQTQSFLESVAFVQTNAAAVINTMATLAKGLWEVTYQCDCWFNYTGAVAGADEATVRLKNTPTGILSEVVSFYAQAGSFRTTLVHRYLLIDTAEIEVRRPTNAVGQTIIFRVSLNCVRVL